MTAPSRIAVLQTSFPGDVILTLPVFQVLRVRFPHARLALVTTPAAAGVAAGHPAIDAVFVYDKRGDDRGLSGLLRMGKALRAWAPDLFLVPHRSLRSAVVALLARAPRRVGFGTSAGRLLLTDRVPYNPGAHEIERNLGLVTAVTGTKEGVALPVLVPSDTDRRQVEDLLTGWMAVDPKAAGRSVIGVAPGSVWATKRWPADRFATLCRTLVDQGCAVVLVGGSEDKELCDRIRTEAGSSGICVAAGHLSLLASAALLQRCSIAVTNDSAPMHLAVGVGTPVVALFGATVPRFGFAPLGPRDSILETLGLACRPCSIHGGPTCPTGTFECMLNISPETVVARVLAGLGRSS
jgi:heptosyltransferase-2